MPPVTRPSYWFSNRNTGYGEFLKYKLK